MGTPLELRLSELRRRIRRLLWLNGLAWLIAVLVGSMALVGVADWLFRFSDPGVRLILSVTIVAATAYVGYRWLIAPLLIRLSDLDLALRIERLHPELKDSLASTVQFIHSGSDPQLGSPELQRQVVDETVRRLETMEFDDVVETRNVRRITATAIAISLATALLVGFNRADAAIAFQRMMLPLSSTTWPKQTELRVLGHDLRTVHSPDAPLRVAIGETVSIHIENTRGPLPENGTIYFRFPDQQQSTQQLTPVSLKDNTQQPHDVYVSSLLVVDGPIQFRAEAGDDRDMPWHTIEAVVPPNLEQLRITLTPPAYTGKPPVELPDGAGHIEALLGTTVAIAARADKPLTEALLNLYDEPRSMNLGPDGFALDADFTVSRPGVSTYWFAFRDREGYDDGQSRHFDLRGIEDSLPTIEIAQPSTNLRITPQAKVPLRLIAKDDLGLKELRLVYRTSADDSNAPLHVLPLFGDDTRPTHQEVEYLFDVAELALKPGDKIELYGEATDAYDLGQRHVARSLERVFTIVTDEEKKQELADRQADLMSDLELVQKQQQSAHEQVRQLQIQLAEADELRPQDLDTLQRAEMTQRNTAKKLTDEHVGIRRRAQALLEDLRNNGVEDPETQGRMTKLDREIDRLNQENLPRIEEDLTAVRKRAQSEPLSDKPEDNGDKPQPSPAVRAEQQKALSDAEDNQRIVLESLRETLNEMARWRTHRDLAKNLDELIDTQQQLQKETADVSQQTLAKTRNELTQQEKTDLERLGDRQRQAAKRLDQLQSEVAETLKSRPDDTSTEAQLLQDVADAMREEATAERMRETARQIQQNNVGAAAENQQQLLKQLQELQDTFENRRETDTAALIKKIKKEEEQLATLKERQQELLKKVQQAENIADPEQRQEELKKLKQEQQQLQDEVEKLSRRLRRLQIRRGRESTARAAQRQQKAAEQLDQDDPIAAAEQAQEALDDLEQAQRELAEQRREAEERLAQEQLEKIADQLRAMIPRQQGVIDETQRLHELYTEQGKWSRSTLRTLRGLADVQRQLKTETEGLVETLTAAEVFALALKGAVRDMDRAAQRLDERLTDEPTQRFETRAKQRFVDLIDALKQDKPDGQANQQQPPPGGAGAPQGGPQMDGIPHLSQLKMLKSMQLDLQERTTELAQRLQGKDEIPPADRQELQDLALEQNQLADLARNLTKITTAPAEPPQPDAGDEEAEQ